MNLPNRIIALVVVFLVLPVCIAQGAPRVLLYHSFDKGLTNVDYSTAPVGVKVLGGVKLRKDGVHGAAAQFPADAADSSLGIDLGGLGNASAGTLALWNILDVKEGLTAPTENLATILDADGKPIFKINKSGHVFVYEDGKEIEMPCFDALWWIMYSREHLAITWETGASGVGTHSGIVKIYWKGRPYGAFVMELNRKPASLVIGDSGAGISADELYLFDAPLPLRAIWELMRQQPASIDKLESAIATRCEIEANRPAAALRSAWDRAATGGIVVEAETGKNAEGEQFKISGLAEPGENGMIKADSAATTASGRAYISPGSTTVRLPIEMDQPGRYALALRYSMNRKMSPIWPQNSTAKTPWTDNYATVKVLVDGKPVAGDGAEKLYPTGVYSNHAGDVTPWSWHVVGDGKTYELSAGKHVVEFVFEKGPVAPVYDAVLLTAKPLEQPEYPRWADMYRIPPSWWVADKRTSVRRGVRLDTYTVSLRNRTDEPYSCEVVVGPDKLTKQQVSADVSRVSLKPHEEKMFKVTFKTPANLAGVSEWANIYLWNEDVALRQKYRLWNNIPAADFGEVSHPVLFPAADKKMQAELRAWLVDRDPNKLTNELKEYAKGKSLKIGMSYHNSFAGSLLGRLDALDAWMAMDAKEIEQFLPDGPAESTGYGNDYDRVGLAYADNVLKTPPLAEALPRGDVDLVTTLKFEGPDPKDPTKIWRGTYTSEKDPDVISAYRNSRWQSMIQFFFGGGKGRIAPYKDTPLGSQANCGVGLVAEAYHLTGDKKYADKAYQMIEILSRKYTHLTKHHVFVIRREDRDWWGTRVLGHYQFKFGMRTYQPLGTSTLDLLWNILTPTQRTIVEHNVSRWGMYEGMAGPLWERPEYFSAANREDMPYVELAKVIGDVGPKKGLQFFYDLYRGVVFPDGIHQCSISGYGGSSGYVTYMLKLQKMGVDVVTGNDALKNCFIAHPRFIFSGGGMPTMGDGGGQNLHGYGASGVPSASGYAWAEKTYKDPIYGKMKRLIDVAGKGGPLATRVEGLRKTYLSGEHDLDLLWPNVFIAPTKGLAILRNRIPAEPIDWVEVLFDYGKMDGRAHGHAAKLATIPSFNGQIVSMDYGYGMLHKPIAGGFHMRSYAHNVVIADGRNQRGASGPIQLGDFRQSYGGKDVQWVDADSKRLYKGIYMRRTVFTAPFGLVDLYLCTSDTEHTYDWMYHSFGVAESTGSLKPVDKLASGGPLTFAVHPRTYKADGLAQVTWVNSPKTKPLTKASTALLDEKAYVRLWSLPAKGTNVSLFTIPMNVENTIIEIDYAMLRRKANSTVFATVQEPWRESAGPKVKSVRPLPVGAGGKTVGQTQAYALEVTLTDGKRQVFFVNYSDGKKTIGPVTTDTNVAVWDVTADGKAANLHKAKGPR